MGLLDAVGAGLNVAAEQSAKVGMEYFHSIIQKERDDRLAEIRATENVTNRAAVKADAAEERGRVADFMKPEVSQANGLLSEGAGLNSADSVGADENVGADVQNRERPATYKQGAERAAVAGDLKSAAVFEGLDNNDEKIKTAQVIADMRQKYNTDRLTQQGQLVMAKLAASIARGENGGKLPADAQMMQFLVENKIVPDMKAAAAWVKEGKRSESDTEQVTTDREGEVEKRVVTKKVPSGKGDPAPARKVVKFGDLK